MVRRSAAASSRRWPTEEEIDRMNRVLEDILATETITTPGGERRPLHSHVVPAEGAFLQDLIRAVRPRVTLEVGVGFGISGMFICDALAEVNAGGDFKHHLIDPMQESGWDNIGLHNLRAAGYGDHIEFLELPAHQALPDLERRGVQVDFAFVDGWHTFDYALVDFFLVDRLLRPGGLIAIDDAEWPSVRKACRYIATNRAYRVHRCLEPGDGFVPPRFPQARRSLSTAAKRIASIRKLLRAEHTITDAELGLVPGSRCIAFEKLADDDGRDCFRHEPF